MRIGIMLRTLDEKGGISIYSRNLVEELLKIDQKNHYILFYRQHVHLGRFASYPNVTEEVVRGANKAIWDQIAIPFACWQHQVDLVFHPKFTAPLLAPCKAVMVVHGADWFVPEQAKFYHPLDIRYIRTMMPLYIRKCDAVISVSKLTTDNFNHALGLPPGKMRTVYLGPGRHFERITDGTVREQTRAQYNLPREFVLTLTKCGGGGDRRKNFAHILQAYARYHRQASTALPLVVGGKDCELLREEHDIPEDGYGKDVLFPGWIEQKDLPAVYSMAELYLHPSNLEAFPQPVVEAMACGTPLITSNANGLEEIAGDAALLVNPDDPGEIAHAINEVLLNASLRADLSARGIARVKNFTWDKCAHETLEILEQVLAEAQ